MIDLDLLNPPQKEATITTEGPLLILAGAGSGKTKALTYRIAFILDAGLAGPDNILAMTFTNKAAGEMKQRIAKLLEEAKVNNTYLQNAYSNVLPWMGTFHSVCVKILKKYAQLVGLNNNFTIYDSQDQLSALKQAMKNKEISTKDFNAHAILSYISSAKNELIDSNTYTEYAQGYFQQVVASIYPEYQNILKQNNAVDFDDLLMLVVKLLTENSNVLYNFQDQFKYILVDEYQDTNHAQYIIVNKLAEKYKNICCVGDDDQSIYSFRGATIKNILTFEKDYPQAKIIKLEQNYRSTKKILNASYNVISKNKSRKDKQLWTDNEEGENIILYTAFDEVMEANWIVNKIIEVSKKEEDYTNIAILYRTNAQSRSLEESFINAGIPYKIIGGVRFYERKEIKDVIAYLKLIYNQKESTSLERIINVPKRGIGSKTFKDLSKESRLLNRSLMEHLIQKTIERDLKLDLIKFTNLIQDLVSKSKELNIVDLIDYLLDKTGYVDMLKDGTLENESRIENLKELISVASKFKDKDPEESLEGFLDEVTLLEGFTDRDGVKNFVTLMTIHSAKGLEYEYVFVVGMEENLFPHANSILDEKEMEEERRLAYVAITRAKKFLYLTHAIKRKYFGKTQSNSLSRFVSDIDNKILDQLKGYKEINYESAYLNFEEDSYADIELPDLNIGDKVKHEYFGIGHVKYIDGTNVKIDFGSIYGVKELMLEYAKIEKL